jgi:hypothetical protein
MKSGDKQLQRTKQMKIRNKLTNPFALIGQGFLAGAILVYSTSPDTPAPQPLSGSAQSATAPQIAGI